LKNNEEARSRDNVVSLDLAPAAPVVDQLRFGGSSRLFSQ